MEKDMEKLLEAMTALVAADGPWKEKRDAVKSFMDSHPDGVNFEEFIAWFEEASHD